MTAYNTVLHSEWQNFEIWTWIYDVRDCELVWVIQILLIINHHEIFLLYRSCFVEQLIPSEFRQLTPLSSTSPLPSLSNSFTQKTKNSSFSFFFPAECRNLIGLSGYHNELYHCIFHLPPEESKRLYFMIMILYMSWKTSFEVVVHMCEKYIVLNYSIESGASSLHGGQPAWT